MKRIGSWIVGTLAALVAVLVAVEWAIWALWFAPGIAGIYLLARECEPNRRALNRYVDAFVLLLTWPWAIALGEYILPLFSSAGSRILAAPFVPEEYGKYDSTPYLLLGFFTLVGCASLTHLVAIQQAALKPTREARVGTYRFFGLGLMLVLASAQFLLGHPILAVVTVLACGLVVIANSSDTADPGRERGADATRHATESLEHT